MSAADRRHAIGVARDALKLAAAAGAPHSELPEAFVPAALLHDAGKTESGLGTFGRVAATLASLGLGRRRVLAWEPGDGAPSRRQGLGPKMARYLRHDELGAALLERAGSDELTVAWAREHHLPEARWTVDRRVGRFLKDADGD